MFFKVLDFFFPPPRKLRDGSTQTYREWKRLQAARPRDKRGVRVGDVKGPIRALDITQG